MENCPLGIPDDLANRRVQLFRCKQKNPYPDVYREWCACPVALAYREEPLPVAFVGGAGYSIMRSAFIFSFS